MQRAFILGFAAFALAALPSPADAAAKAPAFEVTGWIPYWRVATGTADVLPRLSTFSALMPFGYIVQNDGSFYDAYGLGSLTSSTSPLSLALTASAKHAKVKIIPTIMWSNGEAIHRILSDQKSRIALEDRVADLAKSQGFDGVNIDFEGKYAETKPYFSLFLKGLYQRMGKLWVYCAIEARTPVGDRYDGTPPLNATVYANDFAAINNYCDRVQLMTYDQQTVDVKLNRAAQGEPYIPISDPKWVRKVVTLAAKTIPKWKLMIGVATYGYEWETTPLTLSGYRYDMQWAFNPRYAVELAAELGILPTRNAAGELSFTYQPRAVAASAALGVTTRETAPEPSSGSGLPTASTTYSGGATAPASAAPFNILWWSDAHAIADKVALAKELGVRGIAIFKLDGGQDPKMWDVLPRRQ